MAPIDLDTTQSNLLTLGDLGVKRALEKGAQEAEAFVSVADVTSVSIRKLTIDARRGVSSGIGIRVVINGKVGFGAAAGTSVKRIESVAEEAVAVAKIRPADPDFKHLPDPVGLASKDGIVDEGIIEFSEEAAIASMNEVARRALQYDKRIKSVFGNLTLHRGAFAIANSRGIASSSITAHISASANCMATDRGKQKSSFDFIISRRPTDFSEIGETAAKKALKMIEAKPLTKTAKTTVVWENMAIAELVDYLLESAATAENVQEGRSYFKGKIGQEVASRNVTVMDDGQLPDGIRTSRIDGEGIPMRNNMIIDKGVLKSYIYNSYSALRENRDSTGNAERGWPEPFLDLPGTSTINLVVKPGTKKLVELVAEVDEGILVTGEAMGVDVSNPVTGDFSVIAPNAFLIKRGDIANPLEPTSIGGNFFSALRNVRDVGCDALLLDEGRIPSIVLEDLTVSG